MIRRALAGLALFACLLASGFAWMQVNAPLDVTGIYVAPQSGVDTTEACAPDANPMPGVMRIAEETVAFSDRTCRISDRAETVEETSEGPFTTVTLQLVCGDDPVGPNGQDATLWITTMAQITNYVPAGDSYVEAHGTFLSCEEATRLDPPHALE